MHEIFTSMPVEEAPWSVEVKKTQADRIIGPSRALIKRLSNSTKCEIEISWPRTDVDCESQDAVVKLFLRGNAKQRLLAAKTIRAVESGGDIEDEIASLDGGIVIPHRLGDHSSVSHSRLDFEKEAWARWRLLAVEAEHNIHIQMGHQVPS